jgi:hypothetical protein
VLAGSFDQIGYETIETVASERGKMAGAVSLAPEIPTHRAAHNCKTHRQTCFGSVYLRVGGKSIERGTRIRVVARKNARRARFGCAEPDNRGQDIVGHTSE